MTTRSIVIIGGGASGVLLAAHLLRSEPADLRVTLIERRAQLGRGVAYSTRQSDHVLNVPATNMSAFADDPEHFWRWLRTRGIVAAQQRFAFVARRHYGAYLADVLDESRQAGSLSLLNQTAVSLRETPAGVEVGWRTGPACSGIPPCWRSATKKTRFADAALLCAPARTRIPRSIPMRRC